MSYCRWSSEDCSCELYCYADVNGGYTTHVAANRAVGKIPKTDIADLMGNKIEKYAADLKKQMDFLTNCERKPIGLAYDGETFNDPDLKSFHARLVMLRDAGYEFPDYVIQNVVEEIADEERKQIEEKDKC